jgi:predicted nucleic acid-binding protein
VWLFDTVALSETAKPRANPGFLAWLEGVDDRYVHTSVLCLGEIRRGIEMLEPGSKRETLRRWLEKDLRGWLGPRVVDVDSGVAQTWGGFGARGSISPIDALIGASAIKRNLSIVTRNVRDFDGLGVPVVNPWT